MRFLKVIEIMGGAEEEELEELLKTGPATAAEAAAAAGSSVPLSSESFRNLFGEVGSGSGDFDLLVPCTVELAEAIYSIFSNLLKYFPRR